MFTLMVLLMTTATNPEIVFETSKGNITIQLNAEKAPISTKNMMEYVESGFYDGTIFHRVIKGFMVQGGGMTADMKEKSTKGPIKNEAGNGLKNKRGTVAMARTSVVDSATAQFFINVVDNDFLNHTSNDDRGFGYAVIGEVTAGMDVVDAIVGSATGSKNGMGDVPKEAIVIKKAHRKQAATAKTN